VIGNYTYSFFDDQTYADFEMEVLNSVTIGRKYLLFLTDRTVIMDLDIGGKTYYMQETVFGAFEYHNRTIIIKKDAGVFKAYRYLSSDSKRRDMSVITKDFFDGSLVASKEYRKISVNGTGAWGIAVYIDDSMKLTFDYKNGATIFLPSGTHGKRISFSVSSKGYAKIRSISYEYSILDDGYTTIPIPKKSSDHCELSVGGEDGRAYHVAFKWNSNCILFQA
jgi:hypothetical protein